MSILGMTKSTNADVKAKCKIGVIIGIVLIVISVFSSIIYAVVLGSMGAADAVVPMYASCLGY